MNSENTVRRRGWLMMLLGGALAFFMVTAFYHMLIRDQQNPNNLSVLALQDGELILRKNRNGHYLAEGKINGTPVVFLVDTGATQVAVSGDIAQKLGLAKKTRRTLQTASGTTEGWTTTIPEMELGFMLFVDTSAVIVNGLDENTVLLGMNALEQLHITQSAGELRLRPAK
ncbi:MAG: TIGR02281 family clan AA aspartic protease [Proteobacteria bacterium]|nr:TIGR02281 family clan AA aspartic protease [Pseudomonadota bacterium]